MEKREQDIECVKNIFEKTFHNRIEDLDKNLLEEEYQIPTVEYLYFLQELTQVYGKEKVDFLLSKGWKNFTLQGIADCLN